MTNPDICNLALLNLTKNLGVFTLVKKNTPLYIPPDRTQFHHQVVENCDRWRVEVPNEPRRTNNNNNNNLTYDLSGNVTGLTSRQRIVLNAPDTRSFLGRTVETPYRQDDPNNLAVF